MIKFHQKLLSRKTGRIYDSVTLSPDLSRKLGFGREERTFEWEDKPRDTVYYSDHVVNFNPIDFFCVSTTLIKPTHNIGEKMYPVICMVPSTSPEYGVRQSYSPKNPIWFELSHEDIRQPEFILTTITGKLMPFEFGPCSVTLLIEEDVQ